MAAEIFETGFGGDATINGKLFPVVSWTLTIPATPIEFTNSKVGTHPQTVTTFIRANVTIVIDYSLADQPWQPSQGGLVPGTPVTNIVLLNSATANDNWQISSMVIINTPQSLERAGRISTSISMMINGGVITPPFGSPF
jgi:hypothetical protein